MRKILFAYFSFLKQQQRFSSKEGERKYSHVHSIVKYNGKHFIASFSPFITPIWIFALSLLWFFLILKGVLRLLISITWNWWKEIWNLKLIKKYLEQFPSLAKVKKKSMKFIFVFSHPKFIYSVHFLFTLILRLRLLNVLNWSESKVLKGNI